LEEVVRHVASIESPSIVIRIGLKVHDRQADARSRAIVVDSGKLFGTKKERRREPPLRCRALELRLRKTADPPRPSQLRPVPQDSAPGLRSRVTYTRLIYRRLSAFQLLQTCACSAAGSRSLSSFRLVGPPARAFPTPDRPQPKLPSIPTSADLSPLRSSSLLRLAPPGVYLKGSRIPFESPPDGTTGCYRVRSG